MLDLRSEEHRWYARNPEKAAILYVGRNQQEYLNGVFYTLWGYIESKSPGKLLKYSGYKVVYVDEEDYLRLWN